MRNDARRLLARKRQKIHHILSTKDRLPEYISLKVNRILPALRRAELKIIQGSYGKCDDCGENIKKKRLAAVPGATRCTPCQTSHERLRA